MTWYTGGTAFGAISTMSTSPMPVKVDAWPVINWRSIIYRRRCIIITRVVDRVRLGRSIHIKEYACGNMILWRKHPAGSKNPRLRKLVRSQRKRLDDILVRAE